MSLIVHRCTICSHPDIYKRGTVCCYDHCRSGQHQPKFGAPEVIPTWDGMGALVPSITPPGTSWVGQATCGCDSCRALYDSLNGVMA